MEINKQFIHESAVYKLLNEFGINTPTFFTLDGHTSLKDAPFKEDQEVVLKGIANDLWHKSDAGVLFFEKFNAKKIEELHQKMQTTLKDTHQWIETLICEKAAFKKSDLPSEGFVSIKYDHSCGPIISLGLGGIHTEAWALELKDGILMFSPHITSPEKALKQISNHLFGKIWLGKVRQGKALTSTKQLLDFLRGLWKLAAFMETENIALMEMNPVVINADGNPTALDGVGLYHQEKLVLPEKTINPKALLDPQKIAIAGVSMKDTSFGKKILENIIASDLPKENLKVIKPNTKEILDVTCIEDITYLKEDPVDALILALPAPITVQTLEALLEQGGGAKVVYLVAGGIGDGADTEGYAEKITKLLNTKRKEKKWTPAIVGPNNLGVVLGPKRLSSLFISKKRLPLNFHTDGNIGFISQSGAFFITRFSNDPNLPIKYGFCIGNQLDLKASDFLETFKHDDNIEVIAAYTEGFDTLEALRFAKLAKELQTRRKNIVLYIGGRSLEGQAAAAGHTGSMAGNYDLEKKLFSDAGIVVTESYSDFSAAIKWLSAYPSARYPQEVAIITNAGSESVVAADQLGQRIGQTRPRLIHQITTNEKNEINNYLKKIKLNGLVSASNPLDVTPMASEQTFLKACEIYAKGTSDIIVLGMVPLTDMLNVNAEPAKELAEKIKQIAQETQKAIAVVIDSGALYDTYRTILSEAGIPIFNSLEVPFNLFNILTNN